MSVCPRSLLLGLLITLYIQSCVVGRIPNAPVECCFSFYTSPIPVSAISEYKVTQTKCPEAGVIFTTKRGVRVCVNPSFKWVKRAMDMIDRRPVEDSTSAQRNVNAPEPCCFNFYDQQISVSVIKKFEKTGAHCPKPGMIFTKLNGDRVCVNPDSKWVQRAVDKMDQ